MHLIYRWPILDPTGHSLADLKTEAICNLRDVFADQGLTLSGPMRWDVAHGTEPTLTVTAPVTTSTTTSLPVFGPGQIGAAA